MNPKFGHDCELCTFLGHEFGSDLYFCEQGGFGATVISRYSNRPDGYRSGTHLARFDPALGEAYRRAVQRGLFRGVAG